LPDHAISDLCLYSREFRNALDSIKLETERQASFHSNLATSIKTDIEASVTALIKRQDELKKEVQVYVEKEFRDKQAQESLMMKAREKYEQDCMKINSYSAQATLVQGRDLDKINQKLERAHQTVGANERDFQKATKVFADMSVRWEKTWKDFCDKAQDMEEERLDFVKDNLWAYANAISTVCVSDDEVSHYPLVRSGLFSLTNFSSFLSLVKSGEFSSNRPKWNVIWRTSFATTAPVLTFQNQCLS
jgi:hypothetical protein